MEERGVDVVLPKGIVLIGDTRRLDTFSKRRTFELFRRDMTNPEVLTYDELLARACILVGDGAGSQHESDPPTSDAADEDVVDDIPF